jgi:hypothetical protein
MPEVGREALRKGALLLARQRATQRRRRRQALVRRAVQVVAVLALTVAASLLTARELDKARHPAIRAMYGMSSSH